MILKDVIAYADAVKPNAFTDATKTHWINEAEGMIMANVMLATIEVMRNYIYKYTSTWTGAGITFPTTATMLLPTRSDFSIGGTVVVSNLVANSVNNSATKRKILDISEDGLTLTFAAGTFTVGLTADSAGTLTFDGSETVLLVLAPFDKVYRSYLCAMIDYANGEYDRYNNSMQMFNRQLSEFTGWYARTYRPADQ